MVVAFISPEVGIVIGWRKTPPTAIFESLLGFF